LASRLAIIFVEANAVSTQTLLTKSHASLLVHKLLLEAGYSYSDVTKLVEDLRT
jgi:hypothetical protein